MTFTSCKSVNCQVKLLYTPEKDVGDDIDEADLDAELACLEDEFDEIGLDEGIGAAAVPAAAQDASLPAVPMGAVGPAGYTKWQHGHHKGEINDGEEGPL